MMSSDGFRSIVDQVYQKVGMLILWNQGEPYLNPEFPQMVRYAANKGLYTMCSTNASLVIDPRAVIESGLNKLIVSMDGISEISYNAYRINGDYNLVLNNLRALVEAKRSLGKTYPKIIWQFIVMRHNEHEIEAVKLTAKEIGVDKLEFKTVQIYNNEDIGFLPSDHLLSRYQANGKSFELRTKLLNRCRRLWTQPVVNWDGELSICCYDKDLQFRIGNVYDRGFSAIWHSQTINKIRRQILHDRSQYDICRNCGEGIVQKLHL